MIARFSSLQQTVAYRPRFGQHKPDSKAREEALERFLEGVKTYAPEADKPHWQALAPGFATNLLHTLYTSLFGSRVDAEFRKKEALQSFLEELDRTHVSRLQDSDKTYWRALAPQLSAFSLNQLYRIIGQREGFYRTGAHVNVGSFGRSGNPKLAQFLDSGDPAKPFVRIFRNQQQLDAFLSEWARQTGEKPPSITLPPHALLVFASKTFDADVPGLQPFYLMCREGTQRLALGLFASPVRHKDDQIPQCGVSWYASQLTGAALEKLTDEDIRVAIEPDIVTHDAR